MPPALPCLRQRGDREAGTQHDPRTGDQARYVQDGGRSVERRRRDTRFIGGNGRLRIFGKMKGAVLGRWAVKEIIDFFRAERAVLCACLAARIAFEERLFTLPAFHRALRTNQVAGLAFLHLPRDFLHTRMGAHDPGDRVFVRDGQRLQPQKGRPVDVFFRMAGTGQEGEVRRDTEFGEAHGRFFPNTKKYERICIIGP